MFSPKYSNDAPYASNSQNLRGLLAKNTQETLRENSQGKDVNEGNKLQTQHITDQINSLVDDIIGSLDSKDRADAILFQIDRMIQTFREITDKLRLGANRESWKKRIFALGLMALINSTGSAFANEGLKTGGIMRADNPVISQKLQAHIQKQANQANNPTQNNGGIHIQANKQGVYAYMSGVGSIARNDIGSIGGN